LLFFWSHGVGVLAVYCTVSKAATNCSQHQPAQTALSVMQTQKVSLTL
jgi:hypothetical protein